MGMQMPVNATPEESIRLALRGLKEVVRPPKKLSYRCTNMILE
jgi:hypothetical protein